MNLKCSGYSAILLIVSECLLFLPMKFSRLSSQACNCKSNMAILMKGNTKLAILSELNFN